MIYLSVKIGIAFLMLCTLIVVLLLENAPEGYEDDMGWHKGKPK